jgi:DNA-binding transcriptional LysR family regulator
MSIGFTQLTAFRAVADHGSVGRGADALMVSQPAVSKQIKELERSLGVVLFERHAKGVRLTDAGDLLAGYARRVFALIEEAEAAIDDLQGLRRGKLSIGASPTLGTYLLPDVLVRFRQRFPAVSLALEIENAAVLQRRLADGEIDFGLSEVPPARDDLDADAVMQDRLVAVAPSRHVLARKRSVTLRQLCEHPIIVRETGSTTKSLVERALAARDITITPVLSVGSTEAIKRAVAAGLGVAIISQIAAAPDIAAKRLVVIRVTDLDIRRPLYHLRLRNRRESKAATAFLCLVRHGARGRTMMR